MKHLILIAIMASSVIAAVPPPYRISVMTDPDGRITTPTNFFLVNSNLIAQVVPPPDPDGTGVTDGTKGDIIVSSSGQVWSIVDGSITGLKLESVGVTPGVYPNATITVDAKGRVTAVQPGSSSPVDLNADYAWAGRHSFSELETPQIISAILWITNSFGVPRLFIGEAVFTNALAVTSGGTGGKTPEAARQNLGLVIQQDVQQFSPTLSTLDQAGYEGTGPFIRRSASGGGGFSEVGTAVTTGSSATTLWSAAIPDNSAVEYYAELIVGGSTNIAGYRIAATMGNRAGVGSTVEVETIKESETTAGMSAAFARSGTTASLVVQGVAGENLRWDWGLSYRAVALATGGGDTTPPTLQSATISTNGQTLVLVFNEPVVTGPAQDGGLMLNVGAEQIGIGYPPGSATGYGTDMLTYPLGRTIRFGEVLVFGYNQPGGAITDIAGTDLASFTDFAVTNNSTVDPPVESCGDVWSAYTGTINGSTALAYSWNRTHVAQLRIADKTGAICKIEALMVPRLGNPGYNLRMEIWDQDPTTLRPGQRIGIASDSVPADAVSPADPTWLEFAGLYAYLTTGQPYYEVMVADGTSDLSNYVSWARYSSIYDNSIVFGGGGGTGTWTLSSSSRRSISTAYWDSGE